MDMRLFFGDAVGEGLGKVIMDQSGFVAGTLVHTNKGLVPIELIRTGDLVLSGHANGECEPLFKRVVNTVKSVSKQHIIYVDFVVAVEDAEDASYASILFCTENTCFRAESYDDEEDLGWINACDLSSSELHMLTTYNGNEAGITTMLDDDKKILRASQNGEIAYLYHYCRKLDCVRGY